METIPDKFICIMVVTSVSYDAYGTIGIFFSGTTYYLYDQLGRLINSYHPGTGLRATYTYDADNRLTDTYYTVTGWSDAYETYTYNTGTTDSISDGTLTSMRMLSGGSISLGYDYLQRLTTRNIASKLVETYTYKAGSGTNATSTLVNGKKNTLGGTVKSNFTYTYDANGNILTEYNSVSGKTVTYTYDNQNQLLKAVHSDGRTETYTYDTVGNIQSFNNGTTSHSYTYGNSVWRDLLTAVDGTAISYDTVGNPTSYYNGSSYTMSWIEGRRLASVTTGGVATSYQYDESGIRTRKTKSDGSYIVYLIADGMVIGEKQYSSAGSVTRHMRYIFDENGTVCGYAASTNGTSWSYYYFIRNLQGDVLQVFDSSNTVVAEYVYDSWGNILSATGTNAAENPFRYRGYYYDAETGFYYLNSRYYDPEIGRFINADGYVSTGKGLLGFNMFAYCNNNPANFVDFGGDILQSFVDDGNDLNDFFDDVMGGAGAGGRVYHYKVDLSIAARSSITRGGLHNCGATSYSYTTPYTGTSGNGTSITTTNTSTATTYNLTDNTGYKSPAGGGGVTDRVIVNQIEVQFGHGGRHLDGTGLNVSEVNNAIAFDVAWIHPGTGAFYKGEIDVRGVTIEYTSYGVSKGVINVGTYYPKCR